MACLSLFPCVCGKTGNISEELIEMNPSSRRSGAGAGRQRTRRAWDPVFPIILYHFIFQTMYMCYLLQEPKRNVIRKGNDMLG